MLESDACQLQSLRHPEHLVFERPQDSYEADGVSSAFPKSF